MPGWAWLHFYHHPCFGQNNMDLPPTVTADSMRVLRVCCSFAAFICAALALLALFATCLACHSFYLPLPSFSSNLPHPSLPPSYSKKKDTSIPACSPTPFPGSLCCCILPTTIPPFQVFMCAFLQDMTDRLVVFSHGMEW